MNKQFNGSTITILIVEDEKIPRESYKDWLCSFEEEEYKFLGKPLVLTASNINSALVQIKQYRIDAIILDYSFSKDTQDKRSGDKLIDKLPKYLDNLYIALISGYDEVKFELLENKVVGLGFRYDYLSKPLTKDALKIIYHKIVQFIQEQPIPYLIFYSNKPINTTSTYEKLLNIINDVECAIKYLTTILLADCRDEQLTTLIKSFEHEDTFEMWVRLLEKLLIYKGDKNYFVTEIKCFFDKHFCNKETLIKCCNLIDLIINENNLYDICLYKNNETTLSLVLLFTKKILDLHKAMTYIPLISKSVTIENLIEIIEPVFNSFKNALHFVCYYPLLVVEDKQVDEEMSEKWYTYHQSDDSVSKLFYKYKVKFLMGSTLVINVKEFSSILELSKHQIYLSDRKGNFLSLHPFISLNKREDKSIITYNLNCY